MSKRATFRVSLVLPPNATVRDAQEYVLDAVVSWRGSLRPPFAYGDGSKEDELGDPMFGLDSEAVKVVWIKPANPPKKISRRR